MKTRKMFIDVHIEHTSLFRSKNILYDLEKINLLNRLLTYLTPICLPPFTNRVCGGGGVSM